MSRKPAFGLLNIHKPAGPTSHDIVATVRRGTRVKKVGHAGTLDPLASGVLVLCLGPATRLSEYVMGSPKQYRAIVRLGVETNTYDAEGEVVAERPLGDLTAADVEAALAAFRGDITQVPPMYSAVKQGGKRLYDLARAGKEVKREPRPVTIYDLTLAACDLPDVTLAITCSPGTYIRSLAYDLGRALGVGGYLTGLVRTASGSFDLADAVTLDDLQAAMAEDTWIKYLVPPERAVQDWVAVQVDAHGAEQVLHGNPTAADGEPPADGALARLHDPDGRLLALATAVSGTWQPTKVFPI